MHTGTDVWPHEGRFPVVGDVVGHDPVIQCILLDTSTFSLWDWTNEFIIALGCFLWERCLGWNCWWTSLNLSVHRTSSLSQGAYHTKHLALHQMFGASFSFITFGMSAIPRIECDFGVSSLSCWPRFHVLLSHMDFSLSKRPRGVECYKAWISTWLVTSDGTNRTLVRFFKDAK